MSFMRVRFQPNMADCGEGRAVGLDNPNSVFLPMGESRLSCERGLGAGEVLEAG
jgi:hypothetical protein